MAIKILIDSASDISVKEAQELGVELLPMQITFGNDEYYDGVDLLPNQFFDKLVNSKELPKTSQINPFRFKEIYKKLTNEGYEVLVITLSSKLSNTYNNALQASEKYQDKIFVLDSLSACAGERLLCEYALRLIEEGKSIKEIYKELLEKRNKVQIFAVIDTLEYLKKGGRISAFTSFAGELLNIKPVISLINGEVKLIGKTRGTKNAYKFLNEKIKASNMDLHLPNTTIYSGNDDSMIKKYINDNLELWNNQIENVRIHALGSTIGTHIGPDALGVAFFEK